MWPYTSHRSFFSSKKKVLGKSNSQSKAFQRNHANTFWNAAHCEIIWVLVDTFTRSQLCALSFNFAHMESNARRALLSLWHKALLSCFPWALPRHGYPADPTGTSCSSALDGYVGWEVMLQTQTQRSTMVKSLAPCTGTEPPLPGITKPENPQQHSTEHMDVKKTHCV